jgi:hypothetical protein
MSAKTREQLYSDFSDNQKATGAKFKDLIDSFKMIQSAVSDPAASGTSITFIATISQDTNGVITVTKKTVDFDGYQTTANMAGYQNLDLQQVGGVTAGAGESQTIKHNMKHYPTVRLVDETSTEVIPTEYQVKHTDNMTLTILLGDSLRGRYKYILD